ncbi:penicillin-binding protein 2 [Agarivorans sp. MS3-6]|uniref:penicillin-binding protein 2 n=1 Tax=Agarivorans sp. TSD2052 TaxID=2937286 RepID=UPI0020106610|nr:penicillin-binding protein 2 [Agarivorans sp. TSD2052]UPW19891.1 penicillin-binding protein 2 [Agarivorans sp. TSD2052]
MVRKRVAMRDHSAESRLFNRRSLVSIIGTFVLICVLLGNLYYIQFEQHETYTTRSNDNRIKVLPLAPPRGLVYDRNGVLLAENRPNFSLEIVPENVDDLDLLLSELSTLLGLSETDIERFYQLKKHTRRFKPVALKSQLSEQQVAVFAVQQHKYPGASIEASLIRYYPYGDSLTHLLGYVARINARDLERLEKENKLAEYDATRTIGKQGIERYYEEILHGNVGYQEVEVNNRGRIIRTMKIVPPIPGKDLYLNVDIRLQLEAQRLLAGRRGSAVLLDAKTSGVLAMVSSPSYDPNLFVNGISSKNYNKLLNSTDRPLINRATKGVYPPASTVKPQLAVMGLELGKITVEQRIWDPGWFQIPNTKRRFRDWKRWGHGWVDVYKAIEQSVDTYFYKLAYETGINDMHAYMNKFGFGEYTGIDIHEESKANMPSREWKRARYRQPWWQGDTISVGIGQGYWTTTPIQLAQATNILANRGNVITPRILKSVGNSNSHIGLPPQVKEPIKLNDSNNWQVALDGMYGVINKSNGTARKAFKDTRYVAAGKSGTAQVVNIAEDEEYDADKLKEQHRDNAMFVAFAPFEKPEVVASVVVENAGGGSSMAAPLIRQLFDRYFETKGSY